MLIVKRLKKYNKWRLRMHNMGGILIPFLRELNLMRNIGKNMKKIPDMRGILSRPILKEASLKRRAGKNIRI